MIEATPLDSARPRLLLHAHLYFFLYKIMATAGASVIVVDPPTSKPHHPDLTFKFPKRSFGKKSQSRSFQSALFVQWPFIHYDQSKDPVYCHTCALAFKQKSL